MREGGGATGRISTIMQKVERPDLMTYQPHLTYSPLDARSLSPPSIYPPPSPELKVCREDGGSPGGSTMQLRKTSIPLQQHFHRPDNGANIYMKLPNFKQEVSKQKVMGSIIQSSKFPAAQKPDPNLPSKIETEYWPCPPSLAAMGKIHAHTHPHTCLFYDPCGDQTIDSYSKSYFS
ncbi:unnamed protein product [Oncorhynchus mykiss]|uniref:Putative adherens-junction anchoring domain-containing protein n=1 Tax=Oncorhynchus mykiss TaxID=8022 RepID=A0A060WSE1_ONCMY|nr:unnamed protein product [Oncorhynchus mykiss]